MEPGRIKGTPKTGGRQKGTPNRATAAVKEAAREHGPDAINELARLMKHAESERVRVMACREILDRAYGKPRQTLEHAGINSVSIVAPDLNDRERMRRLASFLLEDRGTATTIDGELVGSKLNGVDSGVVGKIAGADNEVVNAESGRPVLAPVHSK